MKRCHLANLVLLLSPLLALSADDTPFRDGGHLLKVVGAVKLGVACGFCRGGNGLTDFRVEKGSASFRNVPIRPLTDGQ